MLYYIYDLTNIAYGLYVDMIHVRFKDYIKSL
jgi:hypothetical protein